MLIGQYTSKLTDKDRVSVPKKIRDEFGDELILAKWYESCLVLVSLSGWERLQKRLTGTNDLVVLPVRDIDRFILASAFEISLDAQGRFVLPELLKEFAGITEDVVFVGLVDRVEIWSTTKWLEVEASALVRATKAIEEIAQRRK